MLQTVAMLRNAPAVTVVLPTYNRAGFLPGAFVSLADQTFTDWELVIVDDGSTDGTRELVDEYVKSHEHTRYVYQDNRGAYAARNRGVDEGTDDTICKKRTALSAGVLSASHTVGAGWRWTPPTPRLPRPFRSHRR